ncbi:hypothetical protein IG631_09213 [Alternaria alternata]|nr:hypothetical protein IG631_09213 [Alternaria alternata]
MVCRAGHCVRTLRHWVCYEFGSAHLWVRLSSTFSCSEHVHCLRWRNELHGALFPSSVASLPGYVGPDMTIRQTMSNEGLGLGRGQATPHGCHLELVASSLAMLPILCQRYFSLDSLPIRS